MTRDQMLAEVYVSNYQLFRFLAGRIVGGPDSQDVIQTAFLKVLKCQREFADADAARRYVKRAVINAAIDFAIKKGKVPQARDLPIDNTARDPAPDTLSILLDIEKQQEQDWMVYRTLPILEQFCRDKHVPVELFLHNRRGVLTACSRRLGLPISTLRSRYLAVFQKLTSNFSR